MKRFISTSLMITFLLCGMGLSQPYNVWEQLPVYGETARAADISQSAPDSIILFGLEDSYYTTDGALHWNNFEKDFSLVFSAYIHPRFSDSIFVNNYNHLTLSGDFGVSWISKPYPNYQPFVKLVISFANTRYMYGITTTSDRVYASTDKGDSWQVVFQRSNVNVKDIAVSQENPLLVFITTSDSIYKSADGGAGWSNITNNAWNLVAPGIHYIAVSPYDDSLLVLYKDFYTNYVLLSYDQGATWEKAFLDPKVSIGIQSIRFAPDNSTIYATARKSVDQGGVYVSYDRGRSWQKLPTNGLMNTNVTDLLIDSNNAQILYAVTRGNGVFKTIDGGNNWLPYNQNLNGAYILEVVESPTNPDIIIAASWNGGVFRSLNGGTSWAMVNVGLSDLNIRDIIWPKDEPGKILLLTEKDGFFISENNGQSWQRRQFTDSLFTYYDMTYDSSNKRLYLGGRSFYADGSPILYSDDWGQTWQRLNVPTGFPTFAFGVAYNHMNASLYVGTSSELYRYDGMSWVNLSGTFFQDVGQYPETIIFYPHTVDTLYILSSADQVYRGTNGGTQWQKLNNMYTSKKIIIDPVNPRIHYALGFYRYISFDYGRTWLDFYDKEGLPRINSFGGSLSPHNRNLIYFNTTKGLYRMTVAPEVATNQLTPIRTNVGQRDTIEVVFQNTGNSILELSNFQLTGIHSSHWNLLDPPNTISLILFEYDTLRVVFQPDSIGDLSTMLSLQTNDPNHNTLQVPLSGNGLGGTLSLSQESIDFGSVYVQQTKEMALTLTNQGNDVLTISDLDIFGKNRTSFQVVNTTLPFDIDVGDQKNITLRFTPDSMGTFNADLVILSNDVYQARRTVALNGVGVAGDIDLVDVQSLDFGSVYLGYSSETTLTIRNAGNANLVIHRMDISDTVFQLVNDPLPLTIAPGQSQNVALSFSPQELRSYQATLSIYSNDPDTEENPVTIVLTGKGSHRSPAELVLSQNEQNFGEVNVGFTSDPWVLTLTNSSNTYDLKIDSIHINEAAFFLEETPTFPYTLDPGASLALPVYFRPDTTRNYYGIMTISGNASNSPLQVNLSGKGVLQIGSIRVSPTELDFGQTPIADRGDTLSVLISNTHSQYPVKIKQFTVSGNRFYWADPDTSIFPFYLAAQNSYFIPIVFMPDQEGTFQGELRIYTNDPNNSLVSVSLTGEGIYSKGTIAVSTETLQFGEVLVDSVSAPLEFTISNVHDVSPFTIDSIRIDRAEFSYQVSGNFPMELVPQQQLPIQVYFHPTEAKTYQGVLTIYSDANNFPALNISLNGTGKNPEPPRVHFDPTTVSGTSGSQLQIGISLSSDLPIQYARIFYHAGGKTQFDSTDLQKDNSGKYTATLPSQLLSERGLVYYFKISDGQYIIRFPQEGILNLPVKLQNLDRTIVGNGAYQMISVPLQLDDPSPLAVLGDNLGEYNEYQWRLFRWVNGQYIELSDQKKTIGVFEPGAAFWLATRSGNSFNTGSGVSTPVADSFVVALQEGWNQIGNPFAFPVDWSSVKKIGNISSDLWGYNPQAGGYEAATVLKPWEGYFVHALENNTRLVFYPQETGLTKRNLLPSLENGWAMRIEAIGQQGVDRDNFIGMVTSAAEEYDPLDWLEPPAIGDHVALFFSRPEWDIPGTYSADWRPVRQDGDVWSFTLSATHSTQPIRLQFTPLGDLPGNFEIWLWDSALNIPVNLQEQSSYKVQLREKEGSRDFQLIVGTSPFIQKIFGEMEIIPKQLTLYPNFPNPFNPETVIKFSIPTEMPVYLAVYNVLGQQIRALYTGQRLKRGYHTIIWKGENDGGVPQASGIYFLVLRAGREVKTRKMMLIR